MVAGPSGGLSGGYYGGSSSNVAIWAQPCERGYCGPWAWYGAGSEVNVNPSLSGQAWWNTSYGVANLSGGLGAMSRLQ